MPSITFSTETEERILNNDPELSGSLWTANGRFFDNSMLLRLASALTKNTVITCLHLNYENTSISDFSADDLAVFMKVLCTRPFDEINLWDSQISDVESVACVLRAIQKNPSQPLCSLNDCKVQPEMIRLFPPNIHLNYVRLPADGVHASQIVDTIASNRNLRCLELLNLLPSFMIPCFQGTMNHAALLELRVSLNLCKERVVDLVHGLSATIRAPNCALRQLSLDNWNWSRKETDPISLAIHENKTIESIIFRDCLMHSKASVMAAMFDSPPLRRHLSLIDCRSLDADVLPNVLGKARGLNGVTCHFCWIGNSSRRMVKELFQGLRHRGCSVRNLDLQGISLEEVALVADTMGNIQIDTLSVVFSDLDSGSREANETAIKSGFYRNASIVHCSLNSRGRIRHTGLVATVDWCCRRNRELPLAVAKASQPFGCHAILPLLLHTSRPTLIAASLISSVDGVGPADA